MVTEINMHVCNNK